MWVRRPVGEALNPEYTVHRQAHPVKVNVWGCFCAAGIGYAYIFNENLDAVLMKRILSENLVQSAEKNNMQAEGQWWVLHDNDKKFRSKLVTDMLHNKGVSTIDFPPYSPDLNPIENLWSIVARSVEEHECATVESLQDIIAAMWATVNVSLLAALAHSMPGRCQAVIAAKGWHTTGADTRVED